MLPASSPSWSEADRLAALRAYGVLDTPREPAFDEITQVAALVCKAPIALVSFVEDTRQFFKSEIGMGVRETPMTVSICAHAILQRSEEHTSELQSRQYLVCRLLLEK